MAHDAVHAVLPGEVPPGMLCPDCAREIPPQAIGSRMRRKPTLQAAYEAALAQNPEALRKHLDPARNSFEHGIMQNGDQIRPCRFNGYPSWFLAHCRTVEEVEAWLPKLSPWWPLPTPPSGR